MNVWTKVFRIGSHSVVSRCLTAGRARRDFGKLGLCATTSLYRILEVVVADVRHVKGANAVDSTHAIKTGRYFETKFAAIVCDSFEALLTLLRLDVNPRDRRR